MSFRLAFGTFGAFFGFVGRLWGLFRAFFRGWSCFSGLFASGFPFCRHSGDWGLINTLLLHFSKSTELILPELGFLYPCGDEFAQEYDLTENFGANLRPIPGISCKQCGNDNKPDPGPILRT